MLRRIIKIVAALVVVVPLAMVAAIPFIGDEALYGALVATPVAGDHADAILNRKQRIEAALARYGDDLAHASTWLAGDDRGGDRPSTQRVVMTLPAPPSSGAGADRGWAVKTEPKGDAPPPPPAVTPPPPVAPRPTVARPTPLDLAPPPPPLASEPEPRPAAEAPPLPAPLPVPKPPTPKLPAAEPMAKVKLPAAREARAPAPQPAARRPAAPDETADQDHKRGLLFYKGIGVDKDFKKAVQWFRRAAEKGHAVAQYNLGIMTYLGQGVDQDYRQAAEWFRRAGEQDHAAAQYNLGFLYYEGKGVERDNLQAYMWIDRAANLGDDKAAKARDTLQKALPRDIFPR